MSSTSRHPPHRRRSHSASSPVPGSRPASTEKWRTALKRPRPTSSRGASYKDLASDASTSKWDVDKWRRGKRPRRDSPSLSSNSRSPCLFGSSPVFRDQWSPTFSMQTNLPSTSDAFELFPSRPQQRRSASSHASLNGASVPASSGVMDDAEDINRLRSTAFGELHRNIEESGEVFVSRMRDWERAHGSSQAVSSSPPVTSDAAAYSEPGTMLSPPWSASRTSSFDDEDDIQIVSGDPNGAYPSPHHPSWTLSDSAMDVDEPSSHPSPARLGSPYDISLGPSGYTTEDETPELTGAFTSSSGSSVSLPLHQHPVSTPSSPAEKAIAALTLVMANGAGGINDYEIVRALDGYPHEEDESLVGEMWH